MPMPVLLDLIAVALILPGLFYVLIQGRSKLGDPWTKPKIAVLGCAVMGVLVELVNIITQRTTGM